jgi:hypothetical protein
VSVATDAEILEEARQVRRLQLVVGLAMNVIATDPDLTVEEAAALVAATRRYALAIFPDKAATYDLIYAPRFQRLMTERFGLQ